MNPRFAGTSDTVYQMKGEKACTKHIAKADREKSRTDDARCDYGVNNPTGRDI